MSRFSGAVHRSFKSEKEAADWLARRSPIRSWHITAFKLKGMADSIPLNPIPDNQKEKDVDCLAHSADTSTPNQPKENIAENDDFTPLVPPSEVSLSPEQNSVLNLVKAGRSVFFTGSAGQLHASC